MSDADRIERGLGGALRPEGDPRPGDADVLSRLIDGTLESLPPAPPPPSRPNLRLRVGLGGGGAAIVAVGLLLLSHSSSPPPAPVAVAPTVPALVAPSAAPVAPAADTAPPEVVVPSPTVAIAPPHAPSLSATDLFSRANEARRKGHDAEAIDDYRALQRDFPKSPEAMASHVALGRLLLDKRSDAVGALAQFDQYLAGASAGTLQEEAMIGRALALQRLGRDDDEKRAWQAVLDTYPQSVYADQARARTNALH